MYSHCSGALTGLLIVTSFVIAQESTTKETVKSPNAETRFTDGSVVRMIILQDTLEVMTKYGKLAIPFSDIRRIDVGLHVPVELEGKIDVWVRNLASPTYREREEATKSLMHVGHLAYHFLRKASVQHDPEVVQRTTALLKQIADKHASELLKIKEDDVIHAKEFAVVGRIVTPVLKAQSTHFGELTVKLSEIRCMRFLVSGAAEFTVDAAKYGSPPEQWLDTGLNVDAAMRLVITSEGKVDLWPQGPNQYVTSPKGYTTAGKGGTFMAGALVGRIGENGKVFLIGERHEGVPVIEGRLFLQIVGSPWNNASSGSYRVQITMAHSP